MADVSTGARDREVEIAALTFECRLAVEAAVVGTRRLETLPASPSVKAELDGILKILEQMADAFADLHGALQRYISPSSDHSADDAVGPESGDLEQIATAIKHSPQSAYVKETDFACRLGNDRNIPRDAAIWLEGRGLVKRVFNSGIRAKTFTMEDLQDLFEVREVFEPIACGLAAAAMSDEEIDWLESAVEHSVKIPDMRVLGGPNDRHNDFHLHVIVGSKNAALIDMLCDNLYYKIHFFSDYFTLPVDWLAAALPGRRDIVAALRARDTALAASEMKRHLAYTRASTKWLGKPGRVDKVEDLAAYRRFKSKQKWTQ
jgi:DNA-binding GntR family transcriptional regulator